MNHRVYNGRNILAIISGGVHVNPWKALGSTRAISRPAEGAIAAAAKPTDRDPWWWDGTNEPAN
jgi:hypothetical protein